MKSGKSPGDARKRDASCRNVMRGDMCGGLDALCSGSSSMRIDGESVMISGVHAVRSLNWA
jgi:hypothetical protein